jgi:putative ATP-binding cassette transporter
LSPGEQQRIAFMRALLTKPDLLFLDEASSALDSETEKAIFYQLEEERRNTAVISIAHRTQVAEFHEHTWRFDPIQSEEDTKGSKVPPTYQIIETGVRRPNGKAG